MKYDIGRLLLYLLQRRLIFYFRRQKMSNDINKEPENVNREIINSQERAKSTGNISETIEEKYNPVKHENYLSEEQMEEYFNETENLTLFHGHEYHIIAKYKGNKGDCPSDEFVTLVDKYNEAWLKFKNYLIEKNKAKSLLNNIIEEKQNIGTKKKLKETLQELLNKQKMMDFAREKLNETFHQIQINELKEMADENVGHHDMRNSLRTMAKQLKEQSEKMDRFKENFSEIVAQLTAMQGDIPEGGIKLLARLTIMIPSSILTEYTKKIVQLKFNEQEWKILNLHLEGKNNTEIAKIIKINKSTVGRNLTETILPQLEKESLEEILKMYPDFNPWSQSSDRFFKDKEGVTYNPDHYCPVNL